LQILGGLTVAGLVAEGAQAVSESGFYKDSQMAIHDAAFGWFPDLNLDELEWPFGPKNTPTILPEVFGGNGLLGGKGAPPGGVLAAPAGTLGSKPVKVADPILAGLEHRNASEYNKTITGNLAKLSSKVTSGIQSHAASDRQDSQREQARIDGVKSAAQRGLAANLARLDGVRRATANVQPALSRIEGVERGHSGSLNTIAHKNFSPNVNVTAYSSIHVDVMSRALSVNSPRSSSTMNWPCAPAPLSNAMPSSSIPVDGSPGSKAGI
jgi:hypothetical protein